MHFKRRCRMNAASFPPRACLLSIRSWIPPLCFSDTMESLPVHPQPGAAAVVESWASRPRSPTADRPSLQLRPPAVIHIDLPAPELKEAHLPGSPRSPRLVAAAPTLPTAAQAALPSLPEKQLGVELHVDRTEAAGHPGVPCWELPPHAHRWARKCGARGWAPPLDSHLGPIGRRTECQPTLSPLAFLPLLHRRLPECNSPRIDPERPTQ